MGKAERYEKILDLVQNKQFISPMGLAKEIGVSLVTIRRDLKELVEQGYLVKEYNAIKIVRDYDKRFNKRHNANLVQKRIIAKLAQEFVQSGDTLFIDTSTTCYEFARVLADSSKNVHIITNSLYTALELMSNFKIDVVLIGGNARQGFFSTIGPLAEKMLANMNVDKFFFSCTKLDERGIYEASILEGNVKVKMFEHSRQHYLLVDSSKFRKASIFRTTGLENVDAVITDKSLLKKYQDILKDKDIEIITPPS